MVHVFVVGHPIHLGAQLGKYLKAKRKQNHTARSERTKRKHTRSTAQQTVQHNETCCVSEQAKTASTTRETQGKRHDCRRHYSTKQPQPSQTSVLLVHTPRTEKDHSSQHTSTIRTATNSHKHLGATNRPSLTKFLLCIHHRIPINRMTQQLRAQSTTITNKEDTLGAYSENGKVRLYFVDGPLRSICSECKR